MDKIEKILRGAYEQKRKEGLEIREKHPELFEKEWTFNKANKTLVMRNPLLRG